MLHSAENFVHIAILFVDLMLFLFLFVVVYYYVVFVMLFVFLQKTKVFSVVVYILASQPLKQPETFIYIIIIINFRSKR